MSPKFWYRRTKRGSWKNNNDDNDKKAKHIKWIKWQQKIYLIEYIALIQVQNIFRMAASFSLFLTTTSLVLLLKSCECVCKRKLVCYRVGRLAVPFLDRWFFSSASSDFRQFQLFFIMMIIIYRVFFIIWFLLFTWTF